MSMSSRYKNEGLIPPRSWEELVSMRDILGTYTGAIRLQEDQEYYDIYLKTIPRDLLLTFLNNLLQGKEVALVINAFPYTRVLQFIPFVRHYILWSKKGEVSKEIIKELVEEKFAGKDWLYFITTDVNKSVPEIWHAHIMVNNKAKILGY